MTVDDRQRDYVGSKMIEWKTFDANSLLARRNGHNIGLIVARQDGVVVWKLDAIYSKWIVKNYGECTRVERAKANLRRAWRKWLAAHKLQEM